MTKQTLLICAVLGLVLGVTSAVLVRLQARQLYSNNSGSTLVAPAEATFGVAEEGVLTPAAPRSPTPSLTRPAAGTPSRVRPKVEAATNYRVPILTYHYIGGNPNPADRKRGALSVTPDMFELQMEYLVKEGYTTISLDTLAAVMSGKVGMPGKPVVLSFDDGYIDFYVNAYPILKKYHLNATMFIPTGLMGQPSYMTWEQIQEIDRDGLVLFQAHSVTHRDLTTLPGKELRSELTESKLTLEQRLGKKVNWMAYPYGKFTANIADESRKAGYVGAVSTLDGVYHSVDNLFALKRRSIDGTNSLEAFGGRL